MPSSRSVAPASTSRLLLTACGLIASVACQQPPAPPPEPLAPRQTILGVHTRFTDEAEEAKIARSLDLVAEMGAGWIVEYFPWAYHEPARGKLEWQHVDQVVDNATRRGLRVLARVDLVPAWARPPNSPPKGLLPQHYGDYAAFLQAFATRYRGRLAGIVVWNEPNLDFEWGFRPVSAEEYAGLLKAAYTAVKAADPAMPVVAAGLAPTLEQSPRALSDLGYLAQLYDAGA
ncbi:MAG: beta-galactosidase, partial [Chloroflexi bacterium]|nr:beta-galactosidase [Chloroflexota bacterium]